MSHQLQQLNFDVEIRVSKQFNRFYLDFKQKEKADIFLNDMDLFNNTVLENRNINEVFDCIQGLLSYPSKSFHVLYEMKPEIDKFIVAEKTAVAMESKSFKVERSYLTQQQLGKNHPVFALLLKDNPDLFSTEGLSTLLMDCVNRSTKPERVKNHLILDDAVYDSLSSIFDGIQDKEIMRRIMSDPKGWTLDAPEEVKDGAEYYAKLGKIISAKDLTDMFTYHVIRDNIQSIQKELNISGIIERHLSICDRILSFHISCSQLSLIETDRVILSQEIPKVVDFFLDVTKLDDQYELSIDDEEGNPHPCNDSKVCEIAGIAIDASVASESNEWTKVGNEMWNGKHANRLHPDRITLYLGLTDDETEIIEANHIDKTRKPWLVKQG